ncbi:glycosyltransferase [Epilithonimonas pallida]|uniref:Glycosyltransferase involved in cell wall bisynthesis n=1 Tax=Epilithonimonas pallida TaxID=373671 RepID=A0ABY1R439_9FLAO|nr:glycosyltransferase [Epilithonimonas pallida]SMP94819.1 Glycosyltransferase involved in cell wall bisynthesis [Epilithonimonas pallida]
MKILIDCSNLRAGGGIQVAISFINDLNKLNLDYHFLVVLSPQMENFFTGKFGENFSFQNLNSNNHDNIFKRSKELKKIEEKFSPDIIFTVFGPSYHKSNFPKIVGFAIPHLIYYNSPYIKNLSITGKIKNKILMTFKKKFFIKNSDALIFETEDARTTFINKFANNKKSYVVGNTLNEIFTRKEDWKFKNFNFKSDINILYLTANYPHKNISIIPKIIDVLLNDYKLENFKFILSIKKEDLGFSDKYDNYIEYIGKVNIENVPSLYDQVDILFMPTLLEVFSTSYLEGMYMSKPIITSDMSFARDVCQDGAIYCDALDAGSYANAIITVISNEDIKNKLIENGLKNFKRFGSSMDRTKNYLRILIDNTNKNGNTK